MSSLFSIIAFIVLVINVFLFIFYLSDKNNSVFSTRTFSQTVGTFDELKKYLQSYVDSLARDDKKRNAK